MKSPYRVAVFAGAVLLGTGAMLGDFPGIALVLVGAFLIATNVGTSALRGEE